MLRFFRAFGKSWFGPAIMGLLMVAFLFLGSGIGGLLGGRLANAVVQAGSRVVTQSQFQSLFQRNEEAYQQRTGQPFPLDEAVKEGADVGMLDDLAAQTAFSEMLSRSGVKPSDEVVAVELRRQAESGDSPGLAQVFDSVTGKFKPEMLEQLVKSNGMTMDQFQQQMADGIAAEDFGSAVANGFQTPRIYAAIEAALLLEGRDITYFVIPASSVPAPPKPTDAQLSALIQQYRDRLMLPERRTLTVVRFSTSALAPTMPADPAAIQQQFAADQAKCPSAPTGPACGKPELRSLVEIPLNDPKDAPTVEAALARGENPQAVAKSVGVDAVTYADQPERAIADRKAAAAAFAMKAGQVSGPVQGDFKTVILKVTKVTPAQPATLAAVGPQIKSELQQSEAQSKILDLTNKFQDLRDGGASVAQAAAKLGLHADTVGPVTAEGKQLGGAPQSADLTKKVLDAAFQLPKGGDSDVEQDQTKGDYFAVHVDAVIPPSPPGLDEKGVRPLLTQVYYQQIIMTALQKKADAAQAALKQGKSFEAVAATYGAQISHQLGMTRAAAQQYQQTLGEAVLGQAFSIKTGALFSAGSDGLKGMVVGRLDAVHAGDPRQVAAVLEALRQRQTQAYLQSLSEQVRRDAVDMIKPRTNLALARSVMGIDAATAARLAPKSPAKGAGK